ncbi:unnamed protein product, partial [Phaeothamnion confervicola]
MVALDLISNALEAGAVVSLADFTRTVDEKRESSPELFVGAINRTITSIFSDYFKKETTDRLPPHVMQVLQHALAFLQLRELMSICSVSQNWRHMAEANCLWREPYLERFKLHEPPSALAQGLVKHHFQRRLQDPMPGDRVEVAWRGKFRLESLEIYNGLAWWLAEVVQKGPNGQYRVHYPGWEARWDEWVPRSRLRWGNDRKAKQLAGRRAGVGDTVEMWCGGVSVPGAWLEASVRRVKGDRLYLGEMLTTGHFWVDRPRVRLV